MSDRPDVGDTVPDIALETPDGGSVKPSDFKGRKLVLFFYPEGRHPRLHDREQGLLARWPRISRRPGPRCSA